LELLEKPYGREEAYFVTKREVVAHPNVLFGEVRGKRFGSLFSLL